LLKQKNKKNKKTKKTKKQKNTSMRKRLFFTENGFKIANFKLINQND